MTCKDREWYTAGSRSGSARQKGEIGLERQAGTELLGAMNTS